MKIAKESWIIAAIGLADLYSTVVFIRHHGAHEANPIFRSYWEMGLFPFILAKMACLVCPLAILEWARRRRPRLVSFALRGAIAGYVMLYGVGFFHLNGHRAEAATVVARGHFYPEVLLPGGPVRREILLRRWEREHPGLFGAKRIWPRISESRRRLPAPAQGGGGAPLVAEF